MSQRIFPLRDLDEERALFGTLDRNLHLLRKLFDVEAVSRGGLLKLAGEPDALDRASSVIERALDRIRGGQGVDTAEVERIFRRAEEERERDRHGRSVMNVEPRTPNQARYIEAIRENVVTFGIGPAGTGKSFLAVAMAVSSLKSGEFRRIVLSRPAVEAGESLGFLPGDLVAKINPYLRPLYDALNELLPRGALKRYMEEDVIEIVPLAYMRGRTLDHAMIILDEAQNCTDGQMKMALTRLGRHSKMVVTGDITQVDLPHHKASGLQRARRILSGIERVAFVYLSKADIVRHPVVAEIVRAYSREEESERQPRGEWLDPAPEDGGRTEGAARSRREREAGRDRGRERAPERPAERAPERGSKDRP